MIAKRHRVIAFDRPGFGYSERPHGSAWSAGTQAEVIRDVFAVLGVNRPIVLGHSWGAAVALALGLNHPDAVRGLVLLSGYYYPTLRADVLFSSPTAIPILGDLLRYSVSPFIGRAMLPLLLKGMFAPLPVPARFTKSFPRRHVCTTRANSRGESRRCRDDPGRPSHAASLSRTVDANRYHGRYEGSCRKGQPSGSASRGNSAQCPPADSRCWTHGSLCGSRRGRESG